MMLPEDRKLLGIQKQFHMEGEGSHEPVKQCRDNRRRLESIPDSANAVTWHFHRVAATCVRFDVVMTHIDRSAGGLILPDLDVRCFRIVEQILDVFRRWIFHFRTAHEVF